MQRLCRGRSDPRVLRVTLEAQQLEAFLMDENRSSTLGQYLLLGDGVKRRFVRLSARETGDSRGKTQIQGLSNRRRVEGAEILGGRGWRGGCWPVSVTGAIQSRLCFRLPPNYAVGGLRSIAAGRPVSALGLEASNVGAQPRYGWRASKASYKPPAREAVTVTAVPR